MESVLLIVHVLIALAIVGLIMLQQGKGAEMGASFGAGSSQTVFGAAGSGNFFSRMTALLVALFFGTSLILATLSKKAGEVDHVAVPSIEKVVEGETPATLETLADDVPVVDETPVTNDVPVVDEPAADEPAPAAKDSSVK